MWICPKCGESHHDQFKECWKCAGAEMQHEISEGEPQPSVLKPEPQLRSLSSILIRVAIAFGVGMLFTAAVSHRRGASLEEAVSLGATIGAVVCLLVGIFFWVVFPFTPTKEPTETTDQHGEPGA